MPFLQDIIHKLEVGGGMRYVRICLAVLALVALVFCYNLRAFKNMSTQEAMDSAQLARNIADGKGFSTLFIRPFSVFLVREHNRQKGGAPGAKASDPGKLRGSHPDLANAPVYPVVLAGLMKVMPFRYSIAGAKKFWSKGNSFWWYQPDFFIALFNQLLLIGMVALVFLLARRLFDRSVAWLSALMLLGTELFWRFSVSGLSTILLMLIFVGLAWCLVLIEEEGREPKKGDTWHFGLAALAGVLVGLGALTRYSFGCLIIPVVAYLALFAGRRGAMAALLALVVFAGAVSPWIVRNYAVSGTPLGISTYTVLEDSIIFPGHKLERSLHPELNQPILATLWNKLDSNTRSTLQNDLPRFAGTWISAFFLVGLMIGFRNPGVRRLRYFLLGSLAILALVQSVARTQLSDDSPVLNSENLLALVAPLAIVYGVALFYLLLDQMILPAIEVRYLVMGAFGVIVCLPMIFVFLPPRSSPVAYPPYYPPRIQSVADLVKPQELTMSDIPWAMAWYGQRQCMWLTLYATPNPRDPQVHEDFAAVSDWQKPIAVLYLTELTLDNRFVSDWLESGGDQGWGNLVLQVMLQKAVPSNFPLDKSMLGWIPRQLCLSDWDRWNKGPGT